YLKQLTVFEFLKEQIGTGYYENLIRTWLLDNPHTSLVILWPERGLADRMEEETREKLEAYKAGLTPEEIQALVEKTSKLRRFQETPATKEELEAIPMLSREDIRREARSLHNTVHHAGDTLILHHDLFTNGIGY